VSTLPLVSVLLPVYNCGHLLREAVQSILDQSYANFELIIVDDHSDDNAIQSLPLHDQRIHLYSNPGKGIINALNYASTKANGEIFARMDGDDISLPHRLETQLDFLLAHPNIDIIGGKVEIFREDATVDLGYKLYEEWINSLTTPQTIADNIFIESPLPHPTVMMHKHTFVQLNGYQDRQWAEDYDLWLRAYMQGLHMAKPEDIVLRWRDEPTRTSRTDCRYSKDNFLKAKSYYLANTLLKQRSALIWGSGPTGVKLCDNLSSLSCDITAFIDVHPRRIGKHKRGRPVIAMDELGKHDGAFIVAAVATRGARADIRHYLTGMKKTEGVDYIFVA